MLLFRWTDTTRTMINCGNGWFIPCDDANRHYQELKPWLHLVREHDDTSEGDADIRALMRNAHEDTSPQPEAANNTQADEVKPAEETSAPGEAGAGVMIDSRAGVMAANQTEELRARRLGEVVMAFSTKVDARFPPGVARELNTLRQRSNAAADGTGDQLTDQEQDRLNELAALEVWFGRMNGEQRRRLDELARADAATLEAYNARAGWP